MLVNNAALQMAQAGGKAIKHMPEGSSIIGTSSVQASSPSPELLDHATTKSGIVTFTRGLAMMVAERGIRTSSWPLRKRATSPEGCR